MLNSGVPARWTAPEGRWTEPDLHLFPQDGHRYEIVDGSLHVTPPPDARHDALVAAVVEVLRAAAPEGWWVCDRSGVAAGESNLVPDVTVLRPRSGGRSWADPADVALVVEVESAETRQYDRLLKPAVYAAAGIPGFWRVEPGPVLRTFTRDGAGYRALDSVEGAEQIRLDAPYPMRVCPAQWRLDKP
ncbi:Uma2 family endonuclease [Actinoplanes sp. DH11]|uniref:Uma2 family endonuclease n=1 Tax=Actinoplanes sp. DH11 TaxID=2857011 RepID=UPI001E31B9F6|nr:Uma2 family endonuclease [Actinoplanes sp. DH11]